MSEVKPLQAWDITASGSAQPAADYSSNPPEGSYRWLHFDLSDPALRAWANTYLPPFAERILLVEKSRPRLDVQEDGCIALSLRGINLNPGEDTTDMVSLRIWATPNLVVTVRRSRVFVMDEMAGDIATGDPAPTPARLVARICEGLVDRLETFTLDLDDIADEVEDEVYDRDLPPSRPIAPMRRTTIKLRRHVGPLADALQDLASLDNAIFPPHSRNRLRDTANRCRRSLDELAELQDRLTALADQLDFIQAARLERNGYLISIAAAIFLPLSFLTGLFGVNVAGMPGVNHPLAFTILCLAMVVLGVILYLVFRFSKWF